MNVNLKEYLNILFKTFFFVFFFTSYNYIINRQHFMILVQTVFKKFFYGDNPAFP